jgi:demethylmenaquinone methyltransferase/2-methoxy-6-polyprenyl-1,4-benzoquinol methylase
VQLKTAKRNLEHFEGAELQLVRGSFEFLPFRTDVFDAIITCYALRDSLNIYKAVEEYRRVCAESGAFADVDIGKPDNLIKRAGSMFYVEYVMPLLAKVMIFGRIRGNPWRMIGPTYKPLPTNKVLLRQFASRFQSIEFKEFLSGGVIVIVARRS